MRHLKISWYLIKSIWSLKIKSETSKNKLIFHQKYLEWDRQLDAISGEPCHNCWGLNWSSPLMIMISPKSRFIFHSKSFKVVQMFLSVFKRQPGSIMVKYGFGTTERTLDRILAWHSTCCLFILWPGIQEKCSMSAISRNFRWNPSSVNLSLKSHILDGQWGVVS